MKDTQLHQVPVVIVGGGQAVEAQALGGRGQHRAVPAVVRRVAAAVEVGLGPHLAHLVLDAVADRLGPQLGAAGGLAEGERLGGPVGDLRQAGVAVDVKGPAAHRLLEAEVRPRPREKA